MKRQPKKDRLELHRLANRYAAGQTTALRQLEKIAMQARTREEQIQALRILQQIDAEGPTV